MNAIISWFQGVVSIFNTIQIKDIVDIAIITLLIFSLFQLIRQTRAEQLLKGVLLLLVLFILTSFWRISNISFGILHITVNWKLTNNHSIDHKLCV